MSSTALRLLIVTREIAIFGNYFLLFLGKHKGKDENDG